jgi:hypothetical protein
MCSGTQERSVSAQGKVPKGLPALAWQDHAGKSIARRWAVAQRTAGARKEKIRRNLASEGDRMGIAALNTRGNGVTGRQLQLEEHCGPPAYRRGCAHASPCEPS